MKALKKILLSLFLVNCISSFGQTEKLVDAATMYVSPHHKMPGDTSYAFDTSHIFLFVSFIANNPVNISGITYSITDNANAPFVEFKSTITKKDTFYVNMIETMGTYPIRNHFIRGWLKLNKKDFYNGKELRVNIVSGQNGLSQILTYRLEQIRKKRKEQ